MDGYVRSLEYAKQNKFDINTRIQSVQIGTTDVDLDTPIMEISQTSYKSPLLVTLRPAPSPTILNTPTSSWIIRPNLNDRAIVNSFDGSLREVAQKLNLMITFDVEEFEGNPYADTSMLSYGRVASDKRAVYNFV